VKVVIKLEKKRNVAIVEIEMCLTLV